MLLPRSQRWLAWYSPSATHRRKASRIHEFWPTWLCLIIDIIATRAKFYEPSYYFTVTNCAHTFCTIKVFVCFRFELANHKFQCILLCTITCLTLNLHTDLNKSWRIRTPTTSILRVPNRIWNASGSWCTSHKQACSDKILQNIWLIFVT